MVRVRRLKAWMDRSGEEKWVALTSECGSECWGGKVNKGGFLQREWWTGCDGGRDLINRVNPFLRSLVVSAEMQSEKGFRPPILNKVYSETTVDAPQVFLWMLGFHSCRLFNINSLIFLLFFLYIWFAPPHALFSGLWPPLPLGEQLHRAAELPLLLSVPGVTDVPHDRRLHLRPHIRPAPHGRTVEAALHRHVSLRKLDVCGCPLFIYPCRCTTLIPKQVVKLFSWMWQFAYSFDVRSTENSTKGTYVSFFHQLHLFRIWGQRSTGKQVQW